MKIVIVGAGGVRTPQVVKALLYKKEKINLSEITLIDINENRLSLIYSVIEELNEYQDVKINYTQDRIKAFKNADFILFTIRVGQISSRIIDEQVPLKYGVIGQETTGPGGFAMAVRTIPVMLDYMEDIIKIAPQAWVLNLSNPAGLITQALVNAGFQKVIGICDSPSGLIEDIAEAISISMDELWFDYFGINHLGWIKSILHNGENILPEVLKNDEALKRHGEKMLEPDFIREIGLIPNEYLLFYYKNKSVLKQIEESGMSRAQLIDRLNEKLFEELQAVNSGGNKGLSPLSIYKKYARARHDSYMKLETSKFNLKNSTKRLWKDTDYSKLEKEPEGYAKIALTVLEGLSGVSPEIIILNVQNGGAVTCLNSNDVVEIPTYVDRNGVHPFLISSIPEHPRGFLQVVKSYERLVIEAVFERSYSKALKALSIHPLVPDISTARLILNEYIVEHKSYFPELK